MIPLLTLLTAATGAAPADTVLKKTFAEKMIALSEMSGEEVVHNIVSGVISLGVKILLAFVILMAGRWLIRYVRRLLRKIMERRNVDVSLRAFLMSLVSITLTIFLIITIIGVLGIDTTSFIAIFASAGLAIGMALSGTLQNFAGGVIVLLFKPFRVGDFIEAQGYLGTVKEIQLIHTILNTPDNKTILLPNGAVSTGSINNYSREDHRRVDWTFGIAYGDDYDKARGVIIGLLESDPRIQKEMPIFVALGALADSSVNLTVRAWVTTSDYWDVSFWLNEQVYKEFAHAGINFPFPQMDVHLKQS